MKRFTLTIFTALILATAVNAQSAQEPIKVTSLTAKAQKYEALSPTELKTLDLTGKYAGKRHQFNADKKTVMQSFEYEFNLTQTGDLISGTSTIIKANGEYADIKLRGMVVGSKLYFEEYEIVDQNKNADMVWCYKSGALNIQKDGDQLKLTGSTESYMAGYYIPCTGGFTDITKVDNSNNFKKDDNAAATASALDASINLAVTPNPFIDQTKINYTISANANVTLEVFDIQGRKIQVLESNAAKTAGAYTVDFSARNNGLAAGVLIAKLTVDGKVYSSEMVQMK